MDKNKNCTACKIKFDKNNYAKNRTVCKSCYNKKKRKANNNTLFQNGTTTSHQQPEIQNYKKINNNGNLIIGCSICGQTYLMIYMLFQNQEPFFVFTKSKYQYPITKAQTPDEIQLLENYENSTVVFEDMLLSKQATIIDLFFTRGRQSKIDIYYISQSYFHLPNNTIRNNSYKFISFKKTLRYVLLLLHDIPGL